MKDAIPIELKERAIDILYANWRKMRESEKDVGLCAGCEISGPCGAVSDRDTFIMFAVGCHVLPEDALDLIKSARLRAIVAATRAEAMAIKERRMTLGGVRQ